MRYRSEGGIDLYAWDGAQLVEGSTDHVTASYTAGVLTVSLPRASIDAAESFGLTGLGAKPSRPRAGKQFTASHGHEIRHRPTDHVGDRRLPCARCRDESPGDRARRSGLGAVPFVVPRTARGKVLRGTISVSTGGKTVARDFAFVVL